MLLPISALEKIIEIAESTDQEDIPFFWLELYKQGWTIEQKRCGCGGIWAWNKNGEFYGCLCHSNPSPNYVGIAHRITSIHDQGGGSSYCSHCLAEIKDYPPHCPNCRRQLLKGQTLLNSGGSDF